MRLRDFECNERIFECRSETANPRLFVDKQANGANAETVPLERVRGYGQRDEIGTVAEMSEMGI